MILYFKIKTLSACMCELMLVVISVETNFRVRPSPVVSPQSVLQTAPDRASGRRLRFVPRLGRVAAQPRPPNIKITFFLFFFVFSF
jgi:hypothetical protein